MATRVAMARSDRSRAKRLLTVIFSAAVVVSVVHYADNYLNYDAYPHAASGPEPSATLILVAWFAFTALGVLGFLRFRDKGDRIACLLLAAYAGSGLVGIGHYTVPGALGMPWWRHAHVLLDIVCGLAVLGFVVWAWPRGEAQGGSAATG